MRPARSRRVPAGSEIFRGRAQNRTERHAPPAPNTPMVVWRKKKPRRRGKPSGPMIRFGGGTGSGVTAQGEKRAGIAPAWIETGPLRPSSRRRAKIFGAGTTRKKKPRRQGEYRRGKHSGLGGEPDWVTAQGEKRASIALTEYQTGPDAPSSEKFRNFFNPARTVTWLFLRRLSALSASSRRSRPPPAAARPARPRRACGPRSRRPAVRPRRPAPRRPARRGPA